ncbi:F0F1 ATP synthase subunit A [Mycoplasma sp. Ms02]|uniref:F0F1 ATP synthase subunit A n=1 Tax=Mycoplasma sp. Ms02 TaxID=353851 RepID=UPI001C895143|nr:F0F1 ATP synthase subunit A [Mycoplasma sp. Ms02]QZE12438.1 F0F1 ATP synthase subunit A [Mycoplasma sp. Ms02]
MDKIWEHFWADKWEWFFKPPLLTLILLVLVCCTISVVVFFKVRKIKPDQAPTGIALLAEQYVTTVNGIFEDNTEGKLPKVKNYIFVLFTFLLVGNLLTVFGLEPISSSLSILIIFGLVTWVGIYVVGVSYHKLKFFKKFLNPIEIVGQFAPLISITFRIYGNIVGGGTVIYLIYMLSGYVWTNLIPGMENHEWFFFAPLFTPILHAYFDVFGAVIQAYVFTVLTCVYWALEAGDAHEESQTEKSKQIIKRQNQAVY